MSLFMIVGSKEPLYQMEIKQQRKNRSTEDSIPMNHFTLHAALDIIDEQMWRTPNMALKVVDQFNGQLVSAYITATNMKLMLLHESRNEDGIKGFFQDVHELFIKLLMNPFYTYDSPIRSSQFDARVRDIAKRHLY